MNVILLYSDHRHIFRVVRARIHIHIHLWCVVITPRLQPYGFTILPVF